MRTGDGRMRNPTALACELQRMQFLVDKHRGRRLLFTTEMVYLALAMLLVLTSGSSSNAHHLQTPPVVEFTSGDTGTQGEADLTRASASAGAFAALITSPGPNGTTLTKVVRYRLLGAFANTVIVDSGDPATRLTTGEQYDDPAISFFGSKVAFVTEAPTGASQVYIHSGGLRSELTLVSNDATGTSGDPVVSGNGRRVAFESRGDLAGTGNNGAQQVFVAEVDAVGPPQQLSVGAGQSGNASMDRWGKRVAFESTSDPATLVDTGIPQVWTADLITGESAPITAGLGASGKPMMSSEGHVVVFESTADLAGTGADTGVPQIYAHELRSNTTARVTDDATGCVEPSVRPYRTDWRIAFMCGGQPYYFMLRADERHRVVAPGDTRRILAGIAPQFMLISTTANMLDKSLPPTPGHQVYLINLFKQDPDLDIPRVPGEAVWFPTRGLSPLR